MLAGGLSPSADANAAWLVGGSLRARFSKGFSLAFEAQHLERAWGKPPFDATQRYDVLGLVARWHPRGRREIDPYVGAGIHRGWESEYPLETCGSGRRLWPLVSGHVGVDVHGPRATVGAELVGVADVGGYGCALPGASDDRPEATPDLAGWMLRIHGAFDVL